MFCPSCGSELSESAKFCANCGAQVAIDSSRTPSTVQTDEASFDNGVQSASVAPSQDPSDYAKGSKKGAYYAIFGIIYGVASILFFFLTYATAIGRGWDIAYLVFSPILSIASIYYAAHAKRYDAAGGKQVVGFVLGIIGMSLFAFALFFGVLPYLVTAQGLGFFYSLI